MPPPRSVFTSPCIHRSGTKAPKLEWDPNKARAIRNTHGVAFEDATLVWDDPMHLVRFDRYQHGEERWHALGMAAGILLLLVVRTYPDDDDRVRIVGLRRATRAERRAYEDGDF
ncbi:MAG TPA: BrnT family toxin [Rhodopila sp.]|nr:BrnT family toxin [Rhodopila sp.]